LEENGEISTRKIKDEISGRAVPELLASLIGKLRLETTQCFYGKFLITTEVFVGRVVLLSTPNHS